MDSGYMLLLLLFFGSHTLVFLLEDELLTSPGNLYREICYEQDSKRFCQHDVLSEFKAENFTFPEDFQARYVAYYISEEEAQVDFYLACKGKCFIQISDEKCNSDKPKTKLGDVIDVPMDAIHSDAARSSFQMVTHIRYCIEAFHVGVKNEGHWFLLSFDSGHTTESPFSATYKIRDLLSNVPVLAYFYDGAYSHWTNLQEMEPLKPADEIISLSNLFIPATFFNGAVGVKVQTIVHQPASIQLHQNGCPGDCHVEADGIPILAGALDCAFECVITYWITSVGNATENFDVSVYINAILREDLHDSMFYVITKDFLERNRLAAGDVKTDSFSVQLFLKPPNDYDFVAEFASYHLPGEAQNLSLTNKTFVFDRKPATKYNLYAYVYGKKSGGVLEAHKTDTVAVFTAESAPSVAPTTGACYGSNTSFTISAGYSHDAPTNGVIVKFTFLYAKVNKTTLIKIDDQYTNVTKPESSLEVNNLVEDGFYGYKVIGWTAVGPSPNSAITYFDLRGNVPDESRSIAGTQIALNSLRISWVQVSTCPGGAILRYEVKLWNVDNLVLMVNTTATSYDFRNLTTWVVTYFAEVAAVNLIGRGPKKTSGNFKLEGIPVRAPDGIYVQTVDASTISLHWQMLTDPWRMGMIQYYRISITPGTRTGAVLLDAASSATDMRIYYLRKGTTHNVTMAGATSQGLGPFSPPFSFTTPQAEPEAPPSNIVVTNASSDELRIAWDVIPEEFRNGEITFYALTLKVGEGAEAWHYTTDLYIVLSYLQPETTYEFKVAGLTAVGVGVFSDIYTHQTLELPVDPPSDLSAYSRTSTTADIYWKRPDGEQHISAYNLSLRLASTDAWKNVTMDPYVVPFIVSGLDEFVTYEYLIAAIKNHVVKAVSEIKTFTTLEDVPDGVPQNVTGRALNSTTLIVSWGFIPLEQRNSIITYYRVTVLPLNVSEPLMEIHTVAENNAIKELILTDLFKATSYVVQLAGASVLAVGPFTSPYIFSTEEDVPDGPPLNVNTSVNFTELYVTWDAILSNIQNGVIISYNVLLRAAHDSNENWISYDTTDQFININGLKDGTVYEVKVAGRTLKGVGVFSEIQKQKTLELPEPNIDPPNGLRAINTSSTSLQFQWNIPDEVFSISAYNLSLRPASTDVWQNFTIDPYAGVFTVSGLDKYVTYEYLIAIVKNHVVKAISEIGTVTTGEDVPDGPPLNVNVASLKVKGVRISWDAIPKATQNGVIISYNVLLRASHDSNGNWVSYDTTVQFININGLKDGTVYEVKVAGRTSKGVGVFSEIHTQRTRAFRGGGHAFYTHQTLVGKRFLGHTSRIERRAIDAQTCMFSFCVPTHNCLSINYNKKLKICELNMKSRTHDQAALQSEPGWEYFEKMK